MNAPTPDPREGKLPRWAQQELDRLRRNLDHAKASRGEGPEGADTFIRDSADGDQPVAKGQTIRFQTGTGIFDARPCEHGLEIRSDSLGDRRMVILPQVSNQVIASTVDR